MQVRKETAEIRKDTEELKSFGNKQTENINNVDTRLVLSDCVHAHVYMHVCVCVRARACVSVCVRACISVSVEARLVLSDAHTRMHVNTNTQIRTT